MFECNCTFKKVLLNVLFEDLKCKVLYDSLKSVMDFIYVEH